MKAPDATGSDGVVVALLDTGPYSITPGRPLGVAGEDPQAQGLLEAHRLAEFTVGPWEVDDSLHEYPGVDQVGLIAPVATPQMMRELAVLPMPLPEIAATHGFLSGFSTVRVSPEEAGRKLGLHNAVMRFPDPAAAAAAAAEMADKVPMPSGADPMRPRETSGTPEAITKSYVFPDDRYVRVDSFTAHGPYVLYQSSRASGDNMFDAAPALVAGALSMQKRRIDEFAPTERAAMAQLPLDPTGQLMARTLAARDNSAPLIIGGWRPRAWLHFEDNPVTATSLFNTASVDAVTQRLTTVYQAANADGAARIVGQFAEELGAAPDVRPVDGVVGMPVARCFERLKGAVPPTEAMTIQRVAWHFKCVASVDRYAYTAFSQKAEDARQQISAQYRILAGQ